jgi:subtilisin family serine protease
MLYTKTLQKQRCKGCASTPEEKLDARWWLPGILVVEFKRRLSPDSIFGSAFTDSMSYKSKTDLSWLDVNKLRHIVGNLIVKPPKWTFQFEREKPPATANYERFITFFLQPDVDVPAIAKELNTVGGVVRATPEPMISPPVPRIPYREPNKVFSAPVEAAFADTLIAEPLLNEPLAVSGGEQFGLAVPLGVERLQNQWYLFRSNADIVINSGTNGDGVVVAVVDWGFNVTHREFQSRIAYTYNAARNNTDVSTGTRKWHGTATLGLVGAGDNDAGMLGFAAGAELWAIQGQDSGANLDNTCWARAIERARTRDSNGKRRVILVEASTNRGLNIESSTTLREPIKTAIADNCVVCVPAGNLGVNAGKGQSNVSIPESGSILVGATQYRSDPDDIRRGVSNWGPRIVVSAPGEVATDVTTCDCGNDSYTNTFGGTSGATAKVAGAMALVLQRFPEVTHQQIVEVLTTRMPQITTADKAMGAFLDVSELMTQVELLLDEDV